MTIPPSQLETWSQPGAQAQMEATYASIREALRMYALPSEIKYEVYLQGSYRNSTNVRANSDVDVVVQLNSSFMYDTSALQSWESDAFERETPSARYHWHEFHRDVLQSLVSYYGSGRAVDDNKCIRVQTAHLRSDVVTSILHRVYRRYPPTSAGHAIEGMKFLASRDRRWIVNYPKLHYANGVTKNDLASDWYKPAVRMIKNARTRACEAGLYPATRVSSYFIECLLFNVPTEHYASNLQLSYLSIISHLLERFADGGAASFMCQNGVVPLFGDSDEQWNLTDAQQLTTALLRLWQTWPSS